MEIITLNTNIYKEKDVILKAVTIEGESSFLVKGMMSNKSVNLPLNNPLVIADVELNEGQYKYPLIKKSKIIHSPYHLNDDLHNMLIINAINEITNRLMQDEDYFDIYPLLNEAIIDLEKKNIDSSSVLLIYLANVLRIIGFDFEINHCIACNSKKNIKAFSFNEGGYICKDCLMNFHVDNLSNEAMMVIRNMFLSTSLKPLNYLNDDVLKEILKAINNFLSDAMGTPLKTLDLLIE